MSQRAWLLFDPRTFTMISMAKSVVIVDDIDGSSNARTVNFGFDGKTYEIDLTKKNATALEKALKPYIDAARTTSARDRRRSTNGRARSRSSSTDLAAIRSWAAANGHQVSSRGRIAHSVVEAYEAARG
jgi:hypothetical protein